MRAVLDSNVFFSMWTLDPLLSFAEADFFDPLWFNLIMDEVSEHLPEAPILSFAHFLIQAQKKVIHLSKN